MRESLEGVTVFVEAAEAGSFAKAAEQLALSRSAVGKAIARLETRLGVRLFHRTTRSQSLTEEGQIYYERCLRALAELRTGAALLESGRKEVIGKLKVSMPLLFGRYCAEPILLDLAEQHPKLELDLRFSDHVVDIVNDSYDLVIRNHAPSVGSALQSRKLADQRRVVCAAPAYLDRHGRPDALDDLARHEALIYRYKERPYPWTFQDEAGQTVEASLSWRLQFDSHEAVADAAVRGMGLAWLPAWLVRDHIDAGRLVPVLEDLGSPRFATYAVWPVAQYYPLKLNVVIDALTERLQWVDAL